VYKYFANGEKYLYNLQQTEQTFTKKSTGLTEVSTTKNSSAKTLDDLDMKIIATLQQDSRLSFNKISTKLQISVGTAYNRIKNLEEKGVVKGYTTILDTTKLGYELTAIILIQAAGKHLTEVEEEIAKINNVIAVYDITGDYDAAIITKFKDRAGLNDFVKNLLSAPHIKRTVTNVALNVIKEDCITKISDA
jgi:DNA-binding Lrp family transcriptional regulator